MLDDSLMERLHCVQAKLALQDRNISIRPSYYSQVIDRSLLADNEEDLTEAQRLERQEEVDHQLLMANAAAT